MIGYLLLGGLVSLFDFSYKLNLFRVELLTISLEIIAILVVTILEIALI